VLCGQFIVVKATVYIGQCYCVVCGDYWGYGEIRYSAMVMGCVWSFFVVTATVDIGQ